MSFEDVAVADVPDASIIVKEQGGIDAGRVVEPVGG
jgi:hypothetical protein